MSLEKIEYFIKIISGLYLVAVLFIIPWLTVTTKQITIKNKYPINKFYNGMFIYSYCIIGDQGDVYNINKSLLFWIYNNHQIYESLEINSKYEIKTHGFTFYWFDIFPNIYHVKRID
jgi:hypothetical protein